LICRPLIATISGRFWYSLIVPDGVADFAGDFSCRSSSFQCLW